MAEWLSLPATAEKLGVSSETVRRLIKAGRLRATLIGDRMKVQEPDVDNYLETHRVVVLPPTEAE